MIDVGHTVAVPGAMSARGVPEYAFNLQLGQDIKQGLSDAGFSGAQIGKINVTDMSTYVAVERGIADKVLGKLNAGFVKGKRVRARLHASQQASLRREPAKA